ncbi:phosphate ABC transporter substrate-binding protein [Syntrophomonas palmitatica]|uniref:phosphate ABC transporter substrate-binding protein n=1 Tax=Syntrophomonas palmitatica TaxID=402877 RepID=UPI0006CF26D6|nr:phosphate ABC transporter substrate-binding protein [Syntrophomonas palmitatica]
MVSKIVRRGISFALLGVLLLMAAFLAGCGQKTDEKAPAQKEDHALTGSLTIAGSTSVQPFSEVLAEKFQEINPKVQINVQGGGSSQGVEAAISGAADIGSSSRELKSEEQGKGLVETKIALDGIAVVVHPSNKLVDMKIEDIRNIYLGNIKNWKEVGGENAPITVVCREEGSGTRGAFEDIVMNKEKISNKVIIQNSTGAVRTTVAGDPKAIGFVSLASLNNEVKAVKIDGIEASVENVKNGSYKISRPFLYLTKGEPQGLAKAFIDYVMSDEGQKIMVDEGAISIK